MQSRAVGQVQYRLQVKCTASVQPCYETGVSDCIVSGRKLLLHLVSSVLILQIWNALWLLLLKQIQNLFVWVNCDLLFLPYCRNNIIILQDNVWTQKWKDLVLCGWCSWKLNPAVYFECGMHRNYDVIVKGCVKGTAGRSCSHIYLYDRSNFQGFVGTCIFIFG